MRGANEGPTVVMYQQRGSLPRKRHVQHRSRGRLLTEEVVGLEGFSGAESILYHLNTPPRIKHAGRFRPIDRDEWVPEAHVHHLIDTWNVEPAGDAVGGRRLLMWNADVEIWFARPERSMETYYRNGEGDELVFVHEGSGTVETILGDLAYTAGDYVVIPRGITYRVRHDGAEPQRHLIFTTPGPVEIPKRYRNQYGQLLEHAPYSNRDIHAPRELRTYDEAGDFPVTVRVRDGFQEYVLDYHPFDVVGWDGYLYPWTFSIHDFEPIVKKVHAPPPVHQTFAGRNFVICSFCPRPLDWHPEAVPIPYNHSNVNSEEMIYYVSGDFSSRRGVDVGSITLHPSGLPHGPQPGLAEKAIGASHTEELAVMCDTFHPLKLTTFARELDDPSYAYSWYEASDDLEVPEPEGIPSIP